MNVRRARLLWAGLTLGALAGCHRDGGEGEPAVQTPAQVRREALSRLTRPHGLLHLLQGPSGAAAGLGAGWLLRLLPAQGTPTQPAAHGGQALRLTATTRYEVTPSAQEEPDAAPVKLTEDSEIQADADPAGGLRIVHNNDHGYGVEALQIKEWLYLKTRPLPFVRRRPEDDEIPRLLAAAEGSDALLELLSPHLEVAVDAAAEEKDSAIPLTLRLRAEAVPLPAGVGPQRGSLGSARGRSDHEASRRWRTATTVESLSGKAVFDPQQRALLSLQLNAAFTAPRPLTGDGRKTSPVQVRVEHRMNLALGASTDKGSSLVTAPPEWLEPPTRPRPMLDRQELLDGLTNQRGAAAAPAARDGRRP